MMRQLLIIGNWKMNCTIDEAIQLATSVRESLGSVVGVEVALCPPFVDLQAVGAVISESVIQLGAQDVFHQDAGAYTGAISSRMLEGLCRYVIVGHSERRQLFGDTDDEVAKKVYAVIRHAMVPILCIGETLDEFDAARTAEALDRQMAPVLQRIEPLADMVIAYEPVWAIGTGRAAAPEAVNETITALRVLVASAWGADVAGQIRILYGGSVDSSNIAAFLRQPEVDGALVGGASLRAQEFCDLVFLAASTRR